MIQISLQLLLRIWANNNICGFRDLNFEQLIVYSSYSSIGVSESFIFFIGLIQMDWSAKIHIASNSLLACFSSFDAQFIFKSIHELYLDAVFPSEMLKYVLKVL